jgi:hypothetical protein
MTHVEDFVHRAARGPQQVPKAAKQLIVAAITVALSGLVSADSRGINFETSQGYHEGSIQDQPTLPPVGWGGSVPPGTINPLIDQQVTAGQPFAPGTFGPQSWRISNFWTTPSATDQPFSPSLTNEAGEKNAQNLGYSGGIRQNHFEAQWEFAVANPFSLETDSFVTINPDRGDGARMSYIRLETHTGGTDVWFRDYQDLAPRGTASTGCGQEDGFRNIRVATVSIAQPPQPPQSHTVKLAIDFLDGPHNDVVKVYVDGVLRQTGTTWEDYYRWCPVAGGGTGTSADQSRTVDSLSFRVEGPVGTTVQHQQNLSFGYLIDNLVYSSNRIGHECEDHRADGDGDVDDKKGHHGHSHFHKKGCDKQDDDDVEHDDDDQGHHFKSTSVDLAQYLATADGRKVTITGIGLDNGLPVGFTCVVVDHDGLVPATYSIILTNGYAFVGEFVAGVVSVE